MPKTIVRDEYGNEIKVPLSAKVIAILTALAAGWTYHTHDERKARAEAIAAETQQRIAKGPYVDRTKALSPTEDLSLVVVPSEFGSPFDVRCLVYKNREFGAVTFTCPDAKQDQLEEGPTP